MRVLFPPVALFSVLVLSRLVSSRRFTVLSTYKPNQKNHLQAFTLEKRFTTDCCSPLSTTLSALPLFQKGYYLHRLLHLSHSLHDLSNSNLALEVHLVVLFFRRSLLHRRSSVDLETHIRLPRTARAICQAVSTKLIRKKEFELGRDCCHIT